jgi:3-hydroxybutyryl-CoA dehydratase
MSRVVTEADIVAYAALSGDYNPVHLDPEYAAKTIFKERIAHGILSAGYISALFGMKLPGPGAIYISQTLNFKGPVKIDDRVESVVRLVELIPDKRRAKFECICSVGNKPVLTGDAVLMVPGKPR